MKKSVHQSVARPFAAALVAGSFAAAAHASMAFESLPGIEGLGSFTGTASWDHSGEGVGYLTFSVVNTSPAENGGYLTGFAFNVVDGLALTLFSAPTVEEGSTWQGMANVAASPWPDFDYGVALGGDWIGGGSPVNGIAVATKGEFVFEVTGEEEVLLALTAETIFDPTPDPDFAARFRGFNDDGSDKVPANLPAPGALALASLASLVTIRRRRNA